MSTDPDNTTFPGSPKPATEHIQPAEDTDNNITSMSIEPDNESLEMSVERLRDADNAWSDISDDPPNGLFEEEPGRDDGSPAGRSAPSPVFDVRQNVTVSTVFLPTPPKFTPSEPSPQAPLATRDSSADAALRARKGVSDPLSKPASSDILEHVTTPASLPKTFSSTPALQGEWLSIESMLYFLHVFKLPDVYRIHIDGPADGDWTSWPPTIQHKLKSTHLHVFAFIRISVEKHWVLLYLDIHATRATIYDSMLRPRTWNSSIGRRIAECFGLAWDPQGWEFCTAHEAPQQDSIYDGSSVFALVAYLHIVSQQQLPAAVGARTWMVSSGCFRLSRRRCRR